MGYRYNIPTDRNGEPPKPEDMLPRFEVRNGAILRIAFKCHYLLHTHDHPMYVYPHVAGDAALLRRENHQPYDRLSQAKLPVETKPIDLVDENYNGVAVTIEEDELAEYIDVTDAYIDTAEPNMIRISLKTSFPNFHDIPKEARFTVFIINDNQNAIDAVCHGILVILPGKPLEIEIGE